MVKEEKFSPKNTFKFILDMFATQAKLMSSVIRFESFKKLPDPE